MGANELCYTVSEEWQVIVRGRAMAANDDSAGRRRIGLKTGARTGVVAGVGFAILSWLAAGILKGVITVFTGVWPEWFPGHIVDFVLSGWWVIIVIVTFTAAGALVGLLEPRRYDLL